jgi:hypothetical protein
MDVSEKMPLLVIGKKKEKSRCFEHCEVPAMYIQTQQSCVDNLRTVHGVRNMFGNENGSQRQENAEPEGTGKF